MNHLLTQRFQVVKYITDAKNDEPTCGSDQDRADSTALAPRRTFYFFYCKMAVHTGVASEVYKCVIEVM